MAQTPTVVWVNGPFGAAKTALAAAVTRAGFDGRLFDAEEIGGMLARTFVDLDVVDFQDLPAWPVITPLIVAGLAGVVPVPLVAVHTVLAPARWTNVCEAIRATGTRLVHLLVDCDVDALRARIGADTSAPGALAWRQSHVDQYVAARAFLRNSADIVFDATAPTTPRSASRVRDELQAAVAAPPSGLTDPPDCFVRLRR